jgi:hypothetical protein
MRFEMTNYCAGLVGNHRFCRFKNIPDVARITGFPLSGAMGIPAKWRPVPGSPGMIFMIAKPGTVDNTQVLVKDGKQA